MLLFSLGVLSAWLVWPLSNNYKPVYVSLDVRTDPHQIGIDRGGIELRWGDGPLQAVALTPRPGVHADPTTMYWDATLPTLPLSRLALRLTGGATRITFIAIAIWTTPVQNWGMAQPLEQWAHLDGLTAALAPQGLILTATTSAAQMELTAFTPITERYQRIETPQTWLYNGFILACMITVIGLWFVQPYILRDNQIVLMSKRSSKQHFYAIFSIFKQYTTRYINLLVCIVTFVMMIILVLMSEKVSVNNGQGWDGVLYTQMAQDLRANLSDLSAYYIQRIFPSTIVYVFSKIFFNATTTGDIIYLFSGLNVIALTLLSYIWCLTADELRISIRGKLLGWISLLVNFAILKLSFFIPIATDYVAYTIGMLTIYFYLKSKYFYLFITTIVGIFTWPTSLILGCILLLFPRTSDLSGSFITNNTQKYIALATSLIGTIYIIITTISPISRINGFYFYRAIFILILGSIFVTVYIFFGLFYLLRGHIFLYKSNVFLLWKHKFNILAVAIILIIRYIQLLVTRPSDIQTDFQILWWTSVMYPGIFYISHILYFGPILILLVYSWKRICSIIHQYGVGITLCILIGLILSLCSESRIFINLIPFIVPFVIKASEELELQPMHYWIFFIFSLLLSKVWMYIGPISEDAAYNASTQLLFMQIGPWMWPHVYVVQAFIVLLMTWFIGYILYKNKQGVVDVSNDALLK